MIATPQVSTVRAANKVTAFRDANVLVSTIELKRRIGEAKPTDTARGMFFNGALNAVKAWAGPEAAQKCAEASGQHTYVDFFSYPVSSFLKLSWAAVDLIGKDLGGADAVFRKLGAQAVTDFLTSVAGKTLITLVGKNPKRLLANTPSAYRAGVSYGERSVTWDGEHNCRLDFRHDFLVHPYHEGVLTAAVEAMGGKNVKVVGHSTGSLDSTYDVSWES